ncbi:hypothetical protein NNC19_02310 [Clostridium sp. SHJSY1]|uniref:hypothetical protein n=1 Tax=Clostridium sp. SHJSY1 TaxID=2942483 RepID=UPI00287541DE|nr:hypothetical protein [Clostridium sp. SHJSY1]MDS0524493.1 hypothetical protein [Clostridium sp. SHJSY1]
MSEKIKFPLVMEDGNTIKSEDELKRYLIIKEYIYNELKEEESSAFKEYYGDYLGGYGIELI